MCVCGGGVCVLNTYSLLSMLLLCYCRDMNCRIGAMGQEHNEIFEGERILMTKTKISRYNQSKRYIKVTEVLETSNLYIINGNNRSNSEGKFIFFNKRTQRVDFV